MARMSDLMGVLKQLMIENEWCYELQRNVLANQFNCVPSQINYVIDTRFTTKEDFMLKAAEAVEVIFELGE
jgi:transcriptional regulator CtsR